MFKKLMFKALLFAAAVLAFGVVNVCAGPWNDFVSEYQGAVSGSTVTLTQNITAATGDNNAFGPLLVADLTLTGNSGNMYMLN